MIQIPKDDLNKTDSYVVKVKGQQIEIEKSTSFASFLGRYVYSNGWSYEMTKVRDVINAEIEKAITEQTRLATEASSILDGRQISGKSENEIQIAVKLQNLNCLQQWIEKRAVKETFSKSLYEEGLAYETGTATIKKDVDQARFRYVEAAALGHAEALIKLADEQRRLYKDCADYQEMQWITEVWQEKVEPRSFLERSALFCLENFNEAKKLPSIRHSLKAVKYYAKAAKGGSVDALYQLATFYHDLKPASASDSELEKIVNAKRRRHLVAAFPGSKKNTEHIAAYYYRQAFQGFKEAADQGSAYACYRLGCLNEETAGGQTADVEASINWFKKAADLGSGDALYKLGCLVEQGILKDAPKTAAEYYKEAVKRGSKDAQYRIGGAYEKGELGLSQDRSIALDFYKQAAVQGQIEALKRLCEWYKNTKADQWTQEIDAIYRYAINRRVEVAKEKINEIEQEQRNQFIVNQRERNYRKGVLIEKQDPDGAIDCYRSAADSGHRDAGYRAALFYFKRLEKRLMILPSNQRHPNIEWHLRETIARYAYIANTPEAFYLIGAAAEKVDHPDTLALYAEAEQKGSTEARFRLAEIYYEKKDWTQSLHYYRKAAENGDVKAEYQLAVFNETGTTEMIAQNTSDAVYWYERAAQNGDVRAQYRLGYIYEQGKLDQAQNKEVAKQWYEKAADQGHPDAKRHLEKLRNS